MIGSITPLGERAPKLGRWMKRALLYAGAATVAGATVGYGVGYLGSFLPEVLSARPLVVGLAGAAFVYAFHELGIVQLPAPGSPWRVPVEWANWSYYRSAIMWGTALGTGLLTALPFPGYLVLLGWLAAIGNPYYGLAVAGLYGFARALPVLLNGVFAFMKPTFRPNPAWLLRTSLVWHPVNGLALLLFAGMLSQVLITEG